MNKIVFKGIPPSKKNSKRIIVRRGKPLIIPSKKYEEWHEEMTWELKIQKIPVVNKLDLIEIVFYPNNKRKCDLSNKAESIMDLLVDNGIIEDDNWFVCPELNLKFGGIDKENPRTEIFIR